MSQYPASEPNQEDDADRAAAAGRLDQSLRDKFSDFRLAPAPDGWAAIERRLPPSGPPQRRPRRWAAPLPWLLPLVLLLGIGGGWLLRGAGRDGAATVPTTVAADKTLSARPGQTFRAKARRPAGLASARTTSIRDGSRMLGVRLGRSAAPAPMRHLPESASVAMAGGAPAPAAVALNLNPNPNFNPNPNPTTPGLAAVPDSVPVALRTLAALERQMTGPAAGRPVLGGPPTRETIVAALRAERWELRRLERRADSLLLALGAAPAALPALLATAPPAADTARPARLLPKERWSVLVSVAPEQNYAGLRAPAGDTLSTLRRHHETGRLGLSATVLGEYRLDPRLSVGAGLGYNRSGAELRLTNRRTDVGITFDTTTTRTTSFFTSTNTVFAIRVEQIPQLSPRFNGSGQVIGYDTVFVSRQDTTFTTIVQRDSIHTVNQTVNPRITKKETVSYRDLRPNYHFLTLPLVFRYRLTPTQGRWWADVSGGMQLQFFLGGTQLVSEDGRTFRTETVGPRGGPFRPLNVGLSGALALNYTLNSRISLSLAPSLRWQVLSVYRPETGLGQNPVATGAQFGVRWKL